MVIKTSTFILFFFAFVASIRAQHNNEFFNDGALVHVQAGAEVHVWGDVHMVNSGTLEHNGLIKVQGNMYSDASFQQRGTGTTRIDNSDVNTTERQFISGSYAVRGGSALTGVDDGSFYDLELANSQGVVYLVNSGQGVDPTLVADVRNTVNFAAGGTRNRIITHDVSTTGVPTYPANGSNYTATFGMMNTTNGSGNYINCESVIYGEMSGNDNSYIQGKHRRAISAAGGNYPFGIGLEPAGINAQRGFQYSQLLLQANNYDVITCYFETASPNTNIPDIECSGYNMDRFWGAEHGEWVYNDINGTGSGDYDIRLWPQDPLNPFTGTVWTISKDDVFLYPSPDPLHNVCGPTPIGLQRGPFNGFSEFGIVSGLTLLETQLVNLQANAINNSFIKVDWTTNQEKDLDYFEIERSVDDMNFMPIAQQNAVGTTSLPQTYELDDNNVLPNINYYYRIKLVQNDGSHTYTHSVVASLTSDQSVDQINLFPNPVMDGDALLEITSSDDKEVTIQVFDAIGQRLSSHQFNLVKGYNVHAIRTTNWPSGVYYIHIKGNQFTNVKELIKGE